MITNKRKHCLRIWPLLKVISAASFCFATGNVLLTLRMPKYESPVVDNQAAAEIEDPSYPWRIVAPSIDTELPKWLEEYIAFHRKSLAQARKAKGSNVKDKNNYMVFYCKSRDRSNCSGTANQQRAILAALMVSILTRRVFLIDIDRPVRLDKILSPHLLEWNYAIPDQKSLKLNKLRMKLAFMDVRNIKPPVLNFPSRFMPNTSRQLLYIKANSPPNFKGLWRKDEMQMFMSKYNITQKNFQHDIYKWLFFALYKPTKILVTRMSEVSEQLSLSWDSTFVAVHIRTGDGQFRGQNNTNNYFRGEIQEFLSCANKMKKLWFTQSTPVVLITDKDNIRLAASAMDPFVKYANTKIVHTDVSRISSNDLEGILNVWVDIFLLARANSTVKTQGSSFSEFGGTLLSNPGSAAFVSKCFLGNYTLHHRI